MKEKLYPVPLQEMEKIDIDLSESDVEVLRLPGSGLVVLDNETYYRMTELGPAGMITSDIFNIFEDETDPEKFLRFARWQMRHVALKDAEYIWDNIYWSLRHEKQEHKHKEAWQGFLKELSDFIKVRKKVDASVRDIQQAFPGENNRAYCLCGDGKIRIYDATPFIKQSTGVPALLWDPAFFKERMCIINNTLAWDTTGDRDPYRCIDIAPEEVYDKSKVLEMGQAIAILDAALNGRPIPQVWSEGEDSQ